MLSAGLARVGEEVLYGFIAGIEKFDEEENAVVGIVCDVAKLLDFAVRQRGFGVLGVQGQGEQNQEEYWREPVEHRFLVFEDLGEQFVVNLVELLEGGL